VIYGSDFDKGREEEKEEKEEKEKKFSGSMPI
jgi:hypothetical protein